MLDVEVNFCYLGDRLCSGRGCDSAIVSLADVVWSERSSGNFCLVLTTIHLSPRIRGKVYEACVFCRLCSMVAKRELTVPWSVGSVASNTETKYHQFHYLGNLVSRMSHRSFAVGGSDGWYGHVQRATSCIKSITNFLIPGTKKKGRPRKTWTWLECEKTDVNKCGLAGVDPLDRDAWRASVRHSLVLPTS